MMRVDATRISPSSVNASRLPSTTAAKFTNPTAMQSARWTYGRVTLLRFRRPRKIHVAVAGVIADVAVHFQVDGKASRVSVDGTWICQIAFVLCDGGDGEGTR